ncbi:hypothetical protein HPP92_008058 [Vanilla planifolia]|uniref:C3H1-type domain-containing protein n=1 Tax=Vanilla planifolia TaxID=51239 RepID=A0A835V8D7_VANPL|nr:hypothetical protein HPP92_008058 [Vanilla planifolia]
MAIPSRVPGEAAFSLSPRPVSLDEENLISDESRLYLARLAIQYQQIADRYELCLSQLQDAECEAEAIRQQNVRLRRANDELTRLLSMNCGKNNGGNPTATDYHSMPLLCDQFCQLSVSEPKEASSTILLGFHDNRRGRGSCDADGKRVPLPKSISVRSTGYLKNPQAGTGCSKSNRGNRHRIPTPVMVTVPPSPSSSITEITSFPFLSLRAQQEIHIIFGIHIIILRKIEPQQQRVYLGVSGKNIGEKVNDAVELEVYTQGMFKTELCNKWQESGECPYGEHCQFAHGIDELRPVIRHPRYKTELCRMVLVGDTCPYGHRCHFRHSVSPQDNLLRPI